jgi:metallo-beta-lactamase family protein
MKITFLGGAGTVTGSKHLVSTESTRLLIDCGLFQGVKSLRQRNWKRFPVDLDTIDAVVLTHAHIDHSGFLPVVVRDGYRGPVYATPPTIDLCHILLPDSGRLKEEDAYYANKEGFTRHSPALPLYTEKDARRVGRSFEPLPFGEDIRVGDLTVRLSPAGHILGAASARVRSDGRSVLFSGDLGRRRELLMEAPDEPGNPDWVVMESTYGDRRHGSGDPFEVLAEVVRRIDERRGILLVPSLAVGRTQTLLYCLDRLFARGLAPRMDVYVNSPMATDVTELYEKHCAYHRLSKEECRTLFHHARFVNSVEESKSLNKKKGPAVIISASGMLTGGRVLHHLKAFAPDEKNVILLPSFQAPGTRGAALAGGAESVKVHGAYIPVRAEVVQLDLFSAHADQDGLLEWIGAADDAPEAVYLVHGEPQAADALRVRVEDSLGFEVEIPETGESVELGAQGAGPGRRRVHPGRNARPGT